MEVSVNTDEVNEARQFQDCRYFSAHEACWRILSHDQWDKPTSPDIRNHSSYDSRVTVTDYWILGNTKAVPATARLNCRQQAESAVCIQPFIVT